MLNHIKNFIKKYYITFIIILGLFFIYYFLTENEFANPYFFPKVNKIYNAFILSKDLIISYMFSSFYLIIPSIFWSLLIGVTIGSIMGINERIRDAINPIIYAFSVIPSILLSPFVLFLAPTIQLASIILIVYNTVWATLFSTVSGIMTIDKRYMDKAEVLELKGIKKFFLVMLPAASPSIIGGFVNSLRSTFVMLVFAEMYGAQNGIGYFVRVNSEFGLYDKVWCGFIFLVIVLVIVMQVFEMIKRILLRWTM